MSPRTDDKPSTDATTDTLTPAPPHLHAASLMSSRGVPLKLKVTKLWARTCTMIKALMDVDVNPAELKLRTLRTSDGRYPAETDAETAPGAPTVVSNPVGKGFMDAAKEDGWVHFHVEFEDRAEPDVETPSPVVPDGDGDATDVDTAIAHFKNGYMKTKKVAGSKRKLSVEDPPEDCEPVHMAFSDFNDTQVKRMLLHVEETDMTDDDITTVLPKDLKQGIREDYARLIGSSKVPWRENEAARRRYIDSVLTGCVYAVNTTNPDKEELLLEPEFPISCADLDVAGAADWVITRGKRMLVVTEAKQCDTSRGQFQLLAMMESLWIRNKQLPEPLQTIQGITTDFQSWLFLERSPKSLKHIMYGSKLPHGKDFPEDIFEICTRFYHMLLNL